MTIRILSTHRAARVLASASLLVGAAATQVRAQAPDQSSGLQRFDTGVVIGGDWLQANALPFDRNAMQSASFGISLRRQSWAIDAGFLRIARSLSTVQGGYVSGGPLFHWKQVLFLPSVGVLGGKSYASLDTSGYNYVGANGVPGHVARFTYSSAAAFGGSVGLTVEAPRLSHDRCPRGRVAVVFQRSAARG